MARAVYCAALAACTISREALTTCRDNSGIGDSPPTRTSGAKGKGSYDTRSSEVAQLSANIILLDRVLAHYGPEAREARDLLRRAVARVIQQIWPERSAGSPQPMPSAGSEALYDKIQALSPQNDARRSIQAQALTISTTLAQTRWLLVGQSGRSIPMPFLVVMVCWLAFIFVSFGLFARPNTTLIVALFVCALSLSSAIFLILELHQPFEGLIQIPSADARDPSRVSASRPRASERAHSARSDSRIR